MTITESAKIKLITDSIPEAQLQRYVFRSQELLNKITAILDLTLHMISLFGKEDYNVINSDLVSIRLALFQLKPDVSSIEFLGQCPCCDCILTNISVIRDIIFYMNDMIRITHSLSFLQANLPALELAYQKACVLRDLLFCMAQSTIVAQSLQMKDTMHSRGTIRGPEPIVNAYAMPTPIMAAA